MVNCFIKIRGKWFLKQSNKVKWFMISTKGLVKIPDRKTWLVIVAVNPPMKNYNEWELLYAWNNKTFHHNVLLNLNVFLSQKVAQITKNNTNVGIIFTGIYGSKTCLSTSFLICYWFDVFIIFSTLLIIWEFFIKLLMKPLLIFSSDFYCYFCLSLLFLLAVILQYTNILNVNITAIST